ncbi:MAG: hypothetical protein F4X83_04530 [Chloroflexi bacterium]|nr:hypothetical protein [Chloroflexota bacterium]
MARRLRLPLVLGLLLGPWLLIATACSIEYVPDAQGTPRPLLRLPATPVSATTQSAPLAAATAPAGPTAAAPASTPDLAPATPAPLSTPALRRLTEPGCCSGVWWSADGSQVLYVDRPDEGPAAIWGVDAATGVQEPYSTVVGVLQHDDRFAIVPILWSAQSVTLHDRETGESWGLFGVGSLPFVSPDGMRIAYDGRVAQEPLYANIRYAPIVVADLDGGNPRSLVTIYGGGIVGWFPDGSRLLILGSETFGEERTSLWTVNVTTGATAKVGDAAQLRDASISPDGAWVAFLALFEKDPALNTTWATNVHSGEKRRLDFVGGYEWVKSEPATLVYVPVRNAPDEGFAVYRLDVAAGERTRLVDPAQTPLFIANGDWALAPDGKRFAFVSHEDYAIWLLDMAP